MLKSWQTYLIRSIAFCYNDDVRYIDNLGFGLTKQDLTNIKIHKRRIINGLEFRYIAPDITISIGNKKHIVAAYSEDVNEWYMFKWDDRHENIRVIKVL